MASELGLELYGVRARVTASSEELLDRARERLLQTWKATACEEPGRVELDVHVADGADGTYLISHGGVELFEAGPEDALDFLETHMRHQLALCSPEKIFIHAGAVGAGGRAIVIPGASQAGKTTLVAALVRAGALYLSDEYGVLDAGGQVHPLIKPLSIRTASGDSRHCPVDALGGQSATGPLPVALVVLARYRPGASWQPRRLTTGEAMLALLRHTAQTRERPAGTLAALKQASSRAVVLEGARGEAEEAAGVLLEALTRL